MYRSTYLQFIQTSGVRWKLRRCICEEEIFGKRSYENAPYSLKSRIFNPADGGKKISGSVFFRARLCRLCSMGTRTAQTSTEIRGF